MATHSSVLAWRIPGTVGPGGLPSMGSHRVRHDLSDLAAAAAAASIGFTQEKNSQCLGLPVQGDCAVEAETPVEGIGTGGRNYS